MKHQPTRRNHASILLPSEIYSRLSQPYQLIARWLEYLPLEDVLALTAFVVEHSRDNDDGTVTIVLRDGTNRAVIIPRTLIKETVRHSLQFAREHLEKLRSATDLHATFLNPDNYEPVTVDDYFRAISEAWKTT